jgi:tetratricopeptide (TPR) repeat protein
MPHSPSCRSFVLILALLLSASGSPKKTPAWPQTSQPIDELVSKLSAVKTDAKRATLLNSSKELVTPELATKLLAQGNLFLNQRQWLQATNAFSAMKETATRLGDKNQVSTAIRAMGAVVYRQNRVEEAIELYKKSLDACQDSCSKNNTVSTTINLAQAYTRQGDYAGALAYLKRAEPLVDLSNRQVAGAFFNVSGEVNKFMGDFSASLAAYKQALASFQADNNEAGVNGIQLNIGTVYETVGDYAQARDYFQKVLVAGNAKNNKPITSQALNNLGNVYYRQGDYAKAMECYEQSLHLKEELKDSFGAANTLNNIANVYYQQGNSSQALAYNQKALEIKHTLGNQRGVANAYLNLERLPEDKKSMTKRWSITARLYNWRNRWAASICKLTPSLISAFYTITKKRLPKRSIHFREPPTFSRVSTQKWG